MKRIVVAQAALVLALAATGAGARAQPVAAAAPDVADPLAGQPDDWAGYAHVGYHLDPHWRVELQGGYKAGATSPADLAPGASPDLCADPMAGAACAPRERALGAYSAVANLIFDAMPDNRWVDPFFSLGAGVSRFDPGPIALANPAVPPPLTVDAGATQLGYQAMVGLAFRPHDRLHVDLTYRWLGGLGGPAVSGPQAALGGRFQDQTVAISVRYAFFAPHRAIAPAPSFGLASAGLGGPAPTRTPAPHTVVVETPSNPAALSAEAEAAVGQTALLASEGRGAQVVVDGHADTVSAADYNQRLLERRAKAMADAMVALGVPASIVDVRWTGDGAEAPAQPSLQARADSPAGR
jgi:opacity protein-like surface antigen